MAKNPPAVQEMWVQSLGGEDPLEKEIATHFSILAWRIPWTEEPGGLHSPWGRQKVGHDCFTNTHTHIHTHRVSFQHIIACREEGTSNILSP